MLETYNVAVGMSRRQKVWKNSRMTWPELADKLSVTVRTPETLEDYRNLGKDAQMDVKDVGGFVGGYLQGGKRTAVKNRGIVCLDADWAGSDTLDLFAQAWSGVAWCAYSTHKHTPDSPRLRIVVPLSRKVDPDEYQAIARKLAEAVGMDAFDDTTYQAQRLMYWPSTSADGEFVYRREDGEAADADTILALYEDWTDASAWPTSSRTAAVMRRELKKQADPLEKPGLVGAFCRAWPIEEAIEEWVEDYEPCDDMAGRYTYTPGSTAGGVVTYDGRWSYSHHDTDPASQQLVNAFDLVRLHKFGDLDEDVKDGTKAPSLPSTKAMLDLVASDKRTGELMYAEERDRVAEDFEVDDGGKDPEEVARERLGKLERDKSGKVMANYANVEAILEYDPDLAGALSFNEFDRMVHVVRSPFLGRRVSPYDDTLRDADSVAIRSHLDRVYGVRGKDLVRDGIVKTAGRHARHPVKEYLESLEWDGVPRLADMLVHWIGCEPTEYTRELTSKTMVGAVARIYEPGCKLDTVLVVKGDQGIGKSVIWQRLAGRWFTDSLDSFRGKDAYEAIQGAWVVEIGELAAMKKAEAEQIKSFLSKQTDRFRKAYGENVESYPRQCIFVGTTNESEFLRDTTGNRRFWIVEAPKGRKGQRHPYYMSQQEADQLWAEAKWQYDADGLQDLSEAAKTAAKDKQAEFSEEDPRAGMLAEYLAAPIPSNWYELDIEDRRDWIQGYSKPTKAQTGPREYVSVPEIMWELFGKMPGTYDRYEAVVLGKLLGSMPGWSDKAAQKRVPGYGSVKVRKRLEE